MENYDPAQLDYLLINKKWTNSVLNCEAYSSFKRVSFDHRIVSAKITSITRSWICMDVLFLKVQNNSVVSNTKGLLTACNILYTSRYPQDERNRVKVISFYIETLRILCVRDERTKTPVFDPFAALIPALTIRLRRTMNFLK